ncbi:helix-turn-helix domain-containing protein [Aureimonas flava]|uniref:Helix-turn-helix domain-containing protein n=1 Tax=Aureimonas flava TaxID=2320271 RepID=A0A3A1WLE2_9HYPH|nr:LexA family transcriptional regulator [Aureimonas flava]RIY00187.1 helix-turn-helix domain-containing protein [Aureimonas flava]
MLTEVKGYVPLDGIFPLCDDGEMSDPITDRIFARLEELGMSPTEASREAGLNHGYLRDLKRKGAKPSYEKIGKLAAVLGLSTEALTTGDSGTKTERARGPIVELTPIVGIIEAGNFRDVSIQSQDDDHPRIPVPQNDLFPNLSQYVLEVRGDSMNKLVLEGTYVVCVPFMQTRLSPRPGMVVHVERSMADGQLIETTLKEIEAGEDGLLLVPRSSNAAHKPIPMDGGEATTIEVKGLVVSLWKPLPKRW